MSEYVSRRHRRNVLAALVSVLALLFAAVACSDRSPAGVAAHPVPASISLPSGTLYLVAGERDIAADLYRVRSGDETVEQITRFAPGPGISSLTAGSGHVIVAAAPQRTDKIYRVVDHRLELLIDDRVFSPALSPDGRLAYSHLRLAAPRPDAAKTWAIVVRDLDTGQERTVYEPSLPTALSSGGAWGPDGSMLLTQRDANHQRPRIVVLGPDGSSRPLDTQLPDPGGASWSRGGWVAVNDFTSAAAELVDPASGERRRLPEGWRARAWSPDGSSLLVSQDRRLGLVSLADVADVQPLGEAQFPVHAAAWVEG